MRLRDAGRLSVCSRQLQSVRVMENLLRSSPNIARVEDGDGFLELLQVKLLTEMEFTELNGLVNDADDKMGGSGYLRLDKTKTKHYRFDFASGPTATQTEVYRKTNKPLVVKALEGYNACCFAYGASTRAARFFARGFHLRRGPPRRAHTPN